MEFVALKCSDYVVLKTVLGGNANNTRALDTVYNIRTKYITCFCLHLLIKTYFFQFILSLIVISMENGRLEKV